jgi:hypothetical protein
MAKNVDDVDDLVETANTEAKKVVDFQTWLIQKPSISDTATGEAKTVWARDLLRVRIAELWCGEMRKRIEKKVTQEDRKALDELIKAYKISR